MKKSGLNELILSALLAALTALLAQFSIPIGPVPITLSTLGVFIAGGLLGWKYGALSMTVYLLLGALGAPVFHAFQGGAHILAGPTGGYIVGYVAAALVTGLIAGRGASRRMLTLGMLAGLLCCYALGTAWFVAITQTAPLAALTLCVFPFIPGDLLKIALAIVLVRRLSPLAFPEKRHS